MPKPAVPYSQELADAICERLAGGETLKAICRDDGMPDDRAVRRWALEDRQGFGAMYERARLIGYLGMADEIIELADDKSADTIVDGEGIRRPDHAAVQRSRLQVDTRKWMLAKALPKVFGDKVHVDGGHTLKFEQDEPSDLELARRIAFVLALGRSEAATLVEANESVTRLNDYRPRREQQ